MPTLPELINALPGDHTVELHVRVPAHDRLLLDVFEDLEEPRIRGQLGEDVDVVARSAWQ